METGSADTATLNGTIPPKAMSSSSKRLWRARTPGDFSPHGLGLGCAVRHSIAYRSFLLEGFGAGPACPKGHTLLFAGELVDQGDHQSASRQKT